MLYIYTWAVHLGNDCVRTVHWLNFMGFGNLCMHVVKKFITFFLYQTIWKQKYSVSSVAFVVGRECAIPIFLHEKSCPNWNWTAPAVNSFRNCLTLPKDTPVLRQPISNDQSRQACKNPTILTQKRMTLRSLGSCKAAWRAKGVLTQALNLPQYSFLYLAPPLKLHFSICFWEMKPCDSIQDWFVWNFQSFPNV